MLRTTWANYKRFHWYFLTVITLRWQSFYLLFTHYTSKSDNAALSVCTAWRYMKEWRYSNTNF